MSDIGLVGEIVFEIINDELNFATEKLYGISKHISEYESITFERFLTFPGSVHAVNLLTPEESDIFLKLLPMVIFISECGIDGITITLLERPNDDKKVKGPTVSCIRMSNTLVPQRTKIIQKVSQLFEQQMSTLSSDQSDSS